MKILRMDNDYKPSFNARFTRKEIDGLIKIAQKDKNTINLGNRILPVMAVGIPKLYALLHLLDKKTGKLAKFVSDSKIHKLYIDDNLIGEGPGTKLDVLCSAMTDYTTEGGEHIKMPQTCLDNMWSKYMDKSPGDIRKMAYEKNKRVKQ